MSDSDDDIRVQAGNSRQVAAARRPARRAESRGSSVASSTATGTRGASASRAPSAPRALVPPAPSLSVLDEAGPSLSSDALLTSDGPTVATYNAHAVNKINGKTSAAAASTKSRPKPKRAALDPAAQKQLEQRRMQDEEEDDFFTRRATVNFRSKKPAVSKLDAVRSPSAPVAGPSNTRPQDVGTPPPTPGNKGKQREIVIDLDDDDESSSSLEEESYSDGDTDRPARKRKSKSKKKQALVRKTSPVKRSMPDDDSSSSSSSTFSFSSSSSLKIIKKGKPDKHHKKKGRISEAREKSLSPIEVVDSSTIAHAIQDLRRKQNMQRQFTPPPVVNSSDNLMQLARDGRGRSSSETTPPPPPRAGETLNAASRSPSRDLGVGDSRNGRGNSLTPVPEVVKETEQDREVKYGPIVSIKVEMIHDLRLPVTDLNRPYVQAYESPLIVKMRQRETFHKLFDAISERKNVPKSVLTFTYNGKTVYTYGSPNALNIISNATFKGCTKDVLGYMKANGVSLRTDGSASPATGSAPSFTNNSNGQGIPAQAQVSAQPENGSSTAPTGTDANPSPERTREETLRLTIRGGKDQKVLIAVPASRTVLSVIKAYLRKHGGDQGQASQCKLLFDGEELAHTDQMGQTDVEDEDTLDIKVPQ